MAACAACGDALPGEETYHKDCFVVGKLRDQEDLAPVPREEPSFYNPDDEKVPVRLKQLDMSNY